MPVQEEVCEENFWKACKITFKEQAYNYTLETCTTPLVKRCDEQNGQQRQQASYGAPSREPETVCKIWFESECNTTFSQVGSSADVPGDSFSEFCCMRIRVQGWAKRRAPICKSMS